MQTKSFEDFYKLNVEPLAAELQAKKKSAVNWKTALFVAAALTILFFISFINNYFSNSGSLAILSMIGFAVCAFRLIKEQDNYTDAFNEDIIRPLIEYWHPQSSYTPASCISSKEYKSSSLYRRDYDYLDGSDLIESTNDHLYFRCSLLHTGYYGGRGGSLITIFKGIFFSASISNTFTGGTYIWTNGNEQLGISIAEEYLRFMEMPEVTEVKFDDTEFENYFSCYSSFPSQAKLLLTDKRRSQMIGLRKQLQHNISFSFVAGHCYAAIPAAEDLLDPTGYDPTNKQQMKKYYNIIQIMFSIADILQLKDLT